MLHYSDKCLCWYFGMLESIILLDTDVRRDVFSSPQKPRDLSKTEMFNVHNAHCKSRDHGESLRHRQILWSSGMQFSGEWEMYNGHCTLYTVHPIFFFIIEIGLNPSHYVLLSCWKPSPGFCLMAVSGTFN